jgi:hypothetical protein
MREMRFSDGSAQKKRPSWRRGYAGRNTWQFQSTQSREALDRGQMQAAPDEYSKVPVVSDYSRESRFKRMKKAE